MKQCRQCGWANQPEFNFCQRCTAALPSAPSGSWSTKKVATLTVSAVVLLLVVGVGVVALLAIVASKAEEREQQRVEQAERERARELAKSLEPKDPEQIKDEVRGEKPRIYGWNGGVLEVDQFFKRTLNDYDSLEWVESFPPQKVDRKDGPAWSVRVRYRASNKLGAKVLQDQVFIIRKGRVVAVE